MVTTAGGEVAVVVAGRGVGTGRGNGGGYGGLDGGRRVGGKAGGVGGVINRGVNCGVNHGVNGGWERIAALDTAINGARNGVFGMRQFVFDAVGRGLHSVLPVAGVNFAAHTSAVGARRQHGEGKCTG